MSMILASGEWQIGLVYAVLSAGALIFAWCIGVFRFHSIDGPARLDPGESPANLLGIALVAFFFYAVLAPAVYGAFVGKDLLSSSQPSSQSAGDFSPEDRAALSAVAPAIGIVALLAGNRLWRRRAFEHIGVTPSGLSDGGIRKGVVAAVITLPLMFTVTQLTDVFWNAIHFQHPGEHDLLRVMGSEPNRAIRALIVISAIVLAPAFEEFFFRGMLQTAIAALVSREQNHPRPMSRWIAILIASIAFTAVHQALWLAPPIFFLSICLGYAYERTGNLWVPIVVHASFNAVSVILYICFH